jgi:CubicO group peptidase (beta-lactamase class C family)
MATIPAATIPKATVVARQDIGAKADQYLTTWAKQGRFSGAVLMAKDGKILLRKAYGNANYELNVANTPKTVFRIGSITKLFTGFSILQLEEKGLLSVNDPVVKYIPELPGAWKAVTIHQLLCHKSGIPDFINAKAYSDLDNSLHVENALKEYADRPLLSKPGETMRYSNSGYILLGRIVEKVSGKTYEEYLNENILKPAGMTHTTFGHASELVPGRASGYRWDGQTVINAWYEDPAFPGSAGALRSTLDDMYRFDRALKSEKLFSPAITAKAWTAYSHWSAPPPFDFQADYGYGWMIGDDFGHRYVGHGGWVNGFVSQFNRYPDDDAVLIVLWNFETSNNIPLSKDLAAILLGGNYEAPQLRPIVHPAQDALSRYVGEYHVGPLKMAISMRNEKLYVLATGQPSPYGLIAVSDTEFYCNDSPAEIKFVKDAKGDVNQVIVRLGGKDIPLDRTTVAQKGE